MNRLNVILNDNIYYYVVRETCIEEHMNITYQKILYKDFHLNKTVSRTNTSSNDIELFNERVSPTNLSILVFVQILGKEI